MIKRLRRRILYVAVASILISSTFLRQLTWYGETTGGQIASAWLPATTPVVERMTKVLIARTVSPSEVKNVVADVRRVNSYRESIDSHLAESLSNCDLLRNGTSTSPFGNGSRTFPNHILCDDRTTTGGDNNYLSVKADFLLFARNGDVVGQASAALATDGGDGRPSENVDIVDVSDNPVKIWNWIMGLSRARLYGYDYVWMVDGDMGLASLNWQSFWKQVKLLRPKVSQPAVVGTASGSFGSTHSILNHQPDSRVLAAETAIVELMAPLFEVNTWLGYRDVIAGQSVELLEHLKKGGEDCFDLAWCHYARANLTGEQLWPPRNHMFRDEAPAYVTSGNSSTHDRFANRSCVVFYQTPIVHKNKRSLNKGRNSAFRVGGKAVCQFFRVNYHIHWAVRSVYEVFVAKS